MPFLRAEALCGFANPGLITVAALFVVAAGLKTTGCIDWVAYRVLGRVGARVFCGFCY